MQEAHVTNRVLLLTRSDGFGKQLRERLLASSVLRRRWPIVDEALRAHKQRNYVLSIPPLLAQVEGIIADALILKNLVKPKGKKLLARQADGSLKRGKDGDAVELRGIGSLVTHSDFQSDLALKDTASFLTTQLVGNRNAILHGRDTSYGRAKLSAQILLVLLVLVSEVDAFEHGRVRLRE